MILQIVLQQKTIFELYHDVPRGALVDRLHGTYTRGSAAEPTLPDNRFSLPRLDWANHADIA
jgi:hypothetical protein